jgi:hypothetical protein
LAGNIFREVVVVCGRAVPRLLSCTAADDSINGMPAQQPQPVPET